MQTSTFVNEELFIQNNFLIQQEESIFITPKYGFTDINTDLNPNSKCTNIQLSNSTSNNNIQITKKEKKNPGVNPNFLGIPKKKRIFFTEEEDEKLKSLVNKHGTRKWSFIASLMNNRTSRQCRDRYFNYLVPGYFKGEWSNEEDDLLEQLYFQFGSKWSFLKNYFPGRTPNALKNRWNYYLCKRYVNNNETQTNEDNKGNQDEIKSIYVGDDYVKTLDFFSNNDDFQLLQQNADFSYNFLI